MEDVDMNESEEVKKKPSTDFKKPILVGKVGRLPRKVQETNEKESIKTDENKDESEPEKPDDSTKDSDVQAPTHKLSEKSLPLPYREPPWSGLANTTSKDYTFDVLKSGKIIETINLMEKPFWVFGRLETCDISMAHPTISRYHAVLQYRSETSEDQAAGFYLYDLNSTHGTFLNKNRLRPQTYVRVQVGHMISVGCSTRMYILNGPEEDAEEESELTVTELKKLREEKIKKFEQEKKEALEKAAKAEEERKLKEEKDGIDWGLGDDADEETDFTENPFAQTNNEELYIEDPKKALRGFMEREGFDLDYDCSEQGMGQFLCKVVLPLDDERGKPIVAEVLHKGKKKEAVVQCALEACRILDRHGVLRQATHESRKRKAKNWEENDYYDSDDDTYLDRTGAIEKKREHRMKAKLPQQPETYQSLLDKEKKISEEIAQIERQLSDSARADKSGSSSAGDEDSLESYMKELTQAKLDKQKISKLKTDLSKLKIEHAQVIKLANIAKPADLPPLVANYSNDTNRTNLGKHKGLPIFGKRKKIKVQLPEKPSSSQMALMDVDRDDEEEEEDETGSSNSKQESRNGETRNESHTDIKEEDKSMNVLEDCFGNSSKSLEAAFQHSSLNIPEYSMDDVKRIFKNYLPKFKHVDDINNQIKRILSEERNMEIYTKTLNIKTQKLLSHYALYAENNDVTLGQKIILESKRLLKEIRETISEKVEVLETVKKMNKTYETALEQLCKELLEGKGLDILPNKDESSSKQLESSSSKSTSFSSPKSKRTKTDDAQPSCSRLQAEEENDTNLENDKIDSNSIDSEKKRKKNQRRIQQRNDKAVMEKQKGYEEDASKEDYNMWVPPEDQSGDGRTSLNEKLGY